MAENESPNASISGDLTDHSRRSVKRTCGTCGNRHMHDQKISSFCELDEFRVGTGLIRAEHHGHILCLDAVRQSRHIAVRYSQRRHRQFFAVEHCCWLRFSYISDRDIETNASAQI